MTPPQGLKDDGGSRTQEKSRKKKPPTDSDLLGLTFGKTTTVTRAQSPQDRPTSAHDGHRRPLLHRGRLHHKGLTAHRHSFRGVGTVRQLESVTDAFGQPTLHIHRPWSKDTVLNE